MKKLILFLALVASICGSAYAAQYTRAVTNRMQALPAAGQKTDAIWSNSTSYAQGALVHSITNGPVHMALVAGTSDADPAKYPSGLGEFADSNIVWIAALGSIRRAWVIQNVSGGPVTIQLDNSSTNGDGIVLTSGQTFAQDGVQAIEGFNEGPALDPASVWQGRVFLIATGSTVTVTEW